MSYSPSISVVIPAFNAESFLAAAVESIQRQQHRQTEIVVVDDGSTDGTLAIAQGLVGVRTVTQANAGSGAARNTGIALARGELLAFLDADDLWTQGKLAPQLNVLKRRPEIDLVGGHVEQFFDPGYSAPPGASPPPTAEAYCAGSVLIRRGAFNRVGGFRTDLKVGEYLDWHSRAVSCGLGMLALPHVVLRRRIHGSNSVLRHRGEYSNYLSVLKSHLARKRQAA
jgi:glycosyltransferase involved in cell wall biosynthesis